MTLVGVLALMGVFGFDAITGGDGTLGPSQKLALIASILTLLVGITLIPLGNEPA